MKRKTDYTYVLVGVFCLLFLCGNRFCYLDSLDKFSVAGITSELKTSRKFRCQYSFKVDGEIYNGYYLSFTKPRSFNSSKKYLVGFNSAQPSKNHLFFRIPINKLQILDSLNSCCTPKDLFNVSDYLSGS